MVDLSTSLFVCLPGKNRASHWSWLFGDGEKSLFFEPRKCGKIYSECDFMRDGFLEEKIGEKNRFFIFILIASDHQTWLSGKFPVDDLPVVRQGLAQIDISNFPRGTSPTK